MAAFFVEVGREGISNRNKAHERPEMDRMSAYGCRSCMRAT
jgi:hypothetical protein